MTMNIDNALKLQRIIFSNPDKHEEFLSALEDVLLKEQKEVIVTPVKSLWPICGCTETKHISLLLHRQLVSKLQQDGYHLPSKTNVDASYWDNSYVGVNQYGDITHYSDSSFFGDGEFIIYYFTSDWVQDYLAGKV